MEGGEIVTMSVDNRIKLFLREGRKIRHCVEGDWVQRVWLAVFNISHTLSFLFCVTCETLFCD